MRVQTLIVLLLVAITVSSMAQPESELVRRYEDNIGDESYFGCSYALTEIEDLPQTEVISLMDSLCRADSCNYCSFYTSLYYAKRPHLEEANEYYLGSYRIGSNFSEDGFTPYDPSQEYKAALPGILLSVLIALIVVAFVIIRNRSKATTPKHAARLPPQQWAQSILAQPDQYIILDTETTGLEYDDVVIEIAAIDLSGTELINTRVLPDCEFSISRSASQIHGITKKQLQNSPTFRAVMQQLSAIAADKTILIYNAEYDTRLLAQTAMKEGWSIDLKNTSCVMLPYAEYIGEWSDYHGNYRFQKLPGGDHTAIGDCRATLKVIHKMASTS
jgi:DNA polymerase-3 subunit epsilon